MAKKRSAAANPAKAWSWLFALAAFVCISACGGARNKAENQPVEGNKAEGSDSSVIAKPAEKELASEVLQLLDKAASEKASDSINAMAADSETAAPERSNRLQSVAGNLDREGVGNAVFEYTPFSEAEIREVAENPLTLDDCIRIALSKNITLRLAKSELLRAEATHAGTYGMFLPTFTLQGGQENTMQKRPFNALAPADPRRLNFYNNFLVGEMQQILPTGTVLSFVGDLRRDLNSPDRFGAPPTRTENLAYMVSLTQPLLRGGWATVTRSSINLTQYDRQMQEKQLASTKLAMIYSVKRAYYNVLLQRELIKVNQAAIQQDSTLVKASESMVQAKVATRRDVLSARIRLADDRAELIRTETEYQLALDALKEIIGLPIEMPIELAETKLSFVPAALDEDALIKLALENSPSTHSAAIAVDRARLALKVARNALLPQLDLTVLHSGQLDTDRDLRKDLWTAGLQASINLSYPFLNREAAANAENAQIAVSQQQDRLVDLQRQIVLGVRSIINSTHSTAEELNALQGTIVAAEEKVEFATAMFRLGRASNLDIIDAQEALLKAQNQYLSKLVDYYTQLALLESLTGQPLTQ
jgi:outer membrane protein TolC